MVKKFLVISITVVSVFADFPQPLIYLPFDDGFVNYGTAGYGMKGRIVSSENGAPRVGVGVKDGAFDVSASSSYTDNGYIYYGGCYGLERTAIEDAIDGLASLTITFWANPANRGTLTNIHFFDRHPGGILEAFTGYWAPRFRINGQWVAVPSNSTGSPVENGWTFYALTYDSTVPSGQQTVRLYYAHILDGDIVAPQLNEVPLSPTYSANNPGAINEAGPLIIGNRNIPGEYRMSGLLDEFRLWGSKTNSFGALSAAEIQQVILTDAIDYINAPVCGDWRFPYPYGDFNKDCSVDLLDLKVLLSGWLSSAFGNHDEAEFYVATASPFDKSRREVLPLYKYNLDEQVRISAAGNESESFQLIIIPQVTHLRNVRIEASPLSYNGNEILLKFRRVEYVKTTVPVYETQYVGWWADPLMPINTPFDVKAGNVQPIWFNTDVPADTPAGIYNGVVRIIANGVEKEVNIELKVHDFSLPMPGSFAAPFGLYESSLRRWYGSFSVEDYAKWCEFMGKYRLTPKEIGHAYATTTIAGQVVENVKYLYPEDAGYFEVDLGSLEQTLRLNADLYYPEYSYSPYRLPSYSQFESQGGNIPEDIAGLIAPLSKFIEEWTQEGYTEKSWIYGVDEPRLDQHLFLKDLYEEIKDLHPEFSIMQTISTGTPLDLIGLVDIWVPITAIAENQFYSDRKNDGDTLWLYTCGWPRPPYANVFIDQDAIDHRILFWQCWKLGATGFLFWSSAMWDGLEESSGLGRFPQVPMDMEFQRGYDRWNNNGDSFLLYPGENKQPLASIRLEVIRDGIEDYEYMKLLEDILGEVVLLDESQRPEQSVLNNAQMLLSIGSDIINKMNDFTKDPKLIMSRRDSIADMIETLATYID